MVKLKAFIFGSVMHLYQGYSQRKNYVSVNNILKVTIFHILHLLAHLAYMAKILSL